MKISKTVNGIMNLPSMIITTLIQSIITLKPILSQGRTLQNCQNKLDIVTNSITSQPPSKSVTGQIRFNTMTSGMESYDGTGWIPITNEIMLYNITPKHCYE